MIISISITIRKIPKIAHRSLGGVECIESVNKRQKNCVHGDWSVSLEWINHPQRE